MGNRAYGTSRPSYGCLGGGRMDEPEYIVTKETEHNGIKVKVMRPVLPEAEARIVTQRIIDDFIAAMTD